MIKAILFIMVFMLSALGLTEFIYSLKLSTLYKLDNDNIATVILLDEKTAVEQIKYAMFQFRWFGNRFSKRIIAVTDNLSDGTYEECRRLTADTEIVLVPNEFLPNVINSVF